MSTLKTALMSEDFPDPRCDRTCISCVHGLCVWFDNTHPTHNKDSESVDNMSIVVIANRTPSDCIPEVVRKQVLQSGREIWSASLPLVCPRPGCQQLRLELWASG